MASSVPPLSAAEAQAITRPSDIERFRRVIGHFQLNFDNQVNSHVREALVDMDAHFRRLHTAHRKAIRLKRSK